MELKFALFAVCLAICHAKAPLYLAYGLPSSIDCCFPGSHLAQRMTTLSISRSDCPLIAHSHIVQILHPALIRPARTARSRLRFPFILSFQNVFRVAGHLNRRHPWPCQKHPCTKTTARYFGRTRSGLPGSFFTCSRYRYPLVNRPLLITSSGFVFLLRMPAIIRLRVRRSTMSAIRLPWATV